MWHCIMCGWANYDIRTVCRNFHCGANRCAFHPDPEIDDACWRQWADDSDWNVAHGLVSEPLPGEEIAMAVG